MIDPADRKHRMQERIDAAIERAGGKIEFEDLARALYPDRESWRYQSNGGPPGCYMTLSAAVRRLGYQTRHGNAGKGTHMIYPRTNA